MSKKYSLFIFLFFLNLLKFSFLSLANNEWLLYIKHLPWTGRGENYSVALQVLIPIHSLTQSACGRGMAKGEMPFPFILTTCGKRSSCP